uniref:Acid protease n=1 Tax=Mycena chlorophos TaxID=658473 RepID=A0ABQ0M1P4_MYCCL|nr:acid protease [Mycena chlorophos]
MHHSSVIFLVWTILSVVGASVVLPRAEFTIPLARKRVQSHKRRVFNRAKSGDNLPLDGAAFESEYLVNITVGGQNFQVILDTGSADFWVANKTFDCFALNGTAIPDPACKLGPAQFDPSLSPTFEFLPNTTFHIEYGSGEYLTGLAGFDTLSVGGVSVTHQEFGVPSNVAFLGDGISEGVLGLAFPGLTSVYSDDSGKHLPYNPFFVNAVQQGAVKNPYFSIALDRPTLEQQEHDPFVPNLGQLSLGGVVPVSTQGKTVALPVIGYAPDANGFFVPTLNTSATAYRLLWYSVLVDGYIFPGSDDVATASNSTIFDSGTTVNYVPSPVAVAYNAHWAVLDEESGNYVVDCAETRPPPFSVLLAGTEFVVDGKDMVVVNGRDAEGNTVCISGVQDGGPVSEGSTFILGDVFLHNVVITHNVVDPAVYIAQRVPY